MDDRWETFAGDVAVRATRHEILEDRFAGWLRAVPDAPIETLHETDDYQWETRQSGAHLQSGLLWAAQYWADNADDEVHLRVSASSRAVPDWPHVCARHEHGELEVEVCQTCGPAVASAWDWGYGPLIPAFEAFCHEGSNQEQPDIESHRPIALARRREDGSVEVAIVGALIRPWLDLPRDRIAAPPLTSQLAALLGTLRDDPRAIAVLGDALQEAGDPRGELIALGDPLGDPALLARHRELLEAGVGRMWLGPVEPHVPRTAVRYRHGIPDAIGLWIDPALVPTLDLDDPLPWAFAPRVRFLPTSARPIGAGLAPVRALGPIDALALEALAATGVTFAASELELELHDPNELDLLFAIADQLPALRALRLVGPAATIALVDRLRAWPRLASLERLEVARVRSAEAHVAELVAWRAARLPCAVAVAMFDADAACASGWSLTIDDGEGEIVVERLGYLLDADAERLARLVAALPRDRIVRRAGTYWAP